jgi:hypothetical protein
LQQLRGQAQQARAEGYFSQAARLERQAVELAGALGLVGERTRALLWEGYSLRQAGEDDLALASLLQAASERAASADAADVFSALVAIIHISLDRKTAEFCRGLLAQGWQYLGDIQQPWTALLEYLEGELAYRRGDFIAAWDWHSRAWGHWPDQHPRLTAATHLWALARTAFRQHDVAQLERIAAQLSALPVTQAIERQLAQRVQLLLWRAQRVRVPSPTLAPTAVIAEIARALLAETKAGDRAASGHWMEALRVLGLLGHWDDVKAALSRVAVEKTEDFFSALLQADLSVAQIRVGLGLFIRDEDYEETTPPALESAGLEYARNSYLLTVEKLQPYQLATVLAAQEDLRLATNHYTYTVAKRTHAK